MKEERSKSKARLSILEINKHPDSQYNILMSIKEDKGNNQNIKSPLFRKSKNKKYR